MWALDHVDPKERIFRDIHNVVIASFRPDIFSRAYVFPTPKQLLSSKSCQFELRTSGEMLAARPNV